jgi:hypothetical protein
MKAGGGLKIVKAAGCRRGGRIQTQNSKSQGLFQSPAQGAHLLEDFREAPAEPATQSLL